MTQAKQDKKRQSPLRWIIGIVAVILVVFGVMFWPQLSQIVSARLPGGAAQSSAPKTAPVTSITAETSVTSAGTVSAVQSGALFWKTTGTVAGVNVKAGDHVQAGEALMTLDALSTPQNVILAQADLIAAQKTLDDLMHPATLTIASAQQNVAKAADALTTAQKNLSYLQSPDIKYYQDQVQKAQDALTNSQQNVALVDIGQLQVGLRNAQKQLQTATDVYNNAKDAFAKCPTCLKVFAYDRMTTWEDAVNLYTDALNQVQQLQTQIDQSQRGTSLTVSTAQDNLDKAQRNLNWILQGPEAVKLQLNQAAVALAQANLADAQDKLNHLLNGADPKDIATAQARLQAVQATLNMLTLTAPFEGEVLAVNYQPGDAVSAGQAAVIVADRSLLRVDAQVDEADIGQIQVGDPVSITVEALPDLVLTGKVSWINGNGATVQGLVKYTVRIDIATSNPRVLLGMTTNVSIVTDTQTGALAVPLDAVQLDQQGEYVNRVSNGSVERVLVTSGQIQGDLVVVSGALQPGDEVQIIPPQASQNPFGGGMGGR